ncbi:CDP-glycerol glycerophosphotransferase family protein [bacterium]|nr:CDP-glycerol glycerophosphotransferase family protein [bacterium]
MDLVSVLIKYPYQWLWRLSNKKGHRVRYAAFLADPLDYIVLRPVLKYLPDFQLIAKNRKTRNYLRRLGLPFRWWRAMPEVVIMARHATYRFPEPKIKKIGFRHGAYHFKKFAGSKAYQAFDCFFVTSQAEVVLARKLGIKNTTAIGFPKLDPAFDNSFTPGDLEILRQKLQLDLTKSTVLFTSTWDKSGMSAATVWLDQLPPIAEKYNVLVTLHPFMSRKIVRKIRNTRNVHFIADPDVLPYMLLADVMIGDMSSIIAEFCALDKPIITFKVPPARRTEPEIIDLLEKISFRITDAAELLPALAHCLVQPDEFTEARMAANKLMFDSLDGLAGRRAADNIRQLLS